MAFNNVRKEMSRALDHNTNNKEANQVNLSKIKSKVDNTTEIKSKQRFQRRLNLRNLTQKRSPLKRLELISLRFSLRSEKRSKS